MRKELVSGYQRQEDQFGMPNAISLYTLLVSFEASEIASPVFRSLENMVGGHCRMW